MGYLAGMFAAVTIVAGSIGLIAAIAAAAPYLATLTAGSVTCIFLGVSLLTGIAAWACIRMTGVD